MPDRIEVTRIIPAPPAAIFDIVRSPAGHVAIDASGMLQDFTGEPAEKAGDTFVIHMDRESLNDLPLGKYDVTVHIIVFERDKEIAWDLGPDVPVAHFYGYRLNGVEDGGTSVTAYYDWSKVSGDLKDRFPIVPESALRATLGILERTVRKGQSTAVIASPSRPQDGDATL
ncbi:MAG: polyketide cyclase [Acidimicrobiales bacterium]